MPGPAHPRGWEMPGDHQDGGSPRAPFHPALSFLPQEPSFHPREARDTKHPLPSSPLLFFLGIKPLINSLLLEGRNRSRRQRARGSSARHKRGNAIRREITTEITSRLCGMGKLQLVQDTEIRRKDTEKLMGEAVAVLGAPAGAAQLRVSPVGLCVSPRSPPAPKGGVLASGPGPIRTRTRNRTWIKTRKRTGTRTRNETRTRTRTGSRTRPEPQPGLGPGPGPEPGMRPESEPGP